MCSPRSTAPNLLLVGTSERLSRHEGSAAALMLLHSARRHAEASGVSHWDYAVLISTLEALGCSRSDLWRLVKKGLVECGTDCTAVGEMSRRFRRTSQPAFDARACFVLTDAGVDAVMHPVGNSSTKGAQPVLPPHWDEIRRELSVRAVAVRRFRRPAPHQELVLAAFQRLHWPPRIEDPLPRDPYEDPKQRLHDVIKRLNRGLQPALIHFSGDGTGTGVCWALDRFQLGTSGLS